MPEKSSQRLAAESRYESVSGTNPWKQDDGTLISRYRYAIELADICREEGDWQAVYSHLSSAADYCSELATRHPNANWESIEAGLQYRMVQIAYAQRTRPWMHYWTAATSQHLSRAKKLDPANFGHLNIDDYSG